MKKSSSLPLTKLNLLLMIILCLIMYFSSFSILSMWILMELTSFLFFSLLLMDKKIFNNMIIIFIMQSLSTIIFLYSMTLFMSLKFFSSNFLMFLFNISLALKIGLFPFITWYKSLIFYMNWNNIFIFTTIMKIIPMTLYSSISPMYFSLTVIVISNLISSISMLYTFNFKNIISYSSIFNSSWLIYTYYINSTWMIICFFIYSLNMFLLCNFFNKNHKIIYSNIMFKNLHIWEKMMFLFNMMSLMSLPPFMGIIYKLMLIHSMIFNLNLAISMFFLSISTINMYSYFKITQFLLYSNNTIINFNSMSMFYISLKELFIILSNLTLFTLLIMI